jgi:hypothetical protein
MCPSSNRATLPAPSTSNGSSQDVPSHRDRLPYRRRVHALAFSLIVLILTLLGGGTAAADPVDPADVPANLRQYVPDSAEWTASPWMTAESCRDHGGDWGTYAAYLIQDFPALLEFFQPKFAGDDGNAAERKKLLVRDTRIWQPT